MMLKIVKNDEATGKHHGNSDAEQQLNEYIPGKKTACDACYE